MNLRKKIREIELSKIKIREAKVSSLSTIPMHSVKLEVDCSNLLEKDDPEMKRIVEEYLQKVNKMGDQLQSERLRQMKNCQLQFDKKLGFLTKKQEEIKQKYSVKFKDYLEKHTATARLLAQYEECEDEQADFEDIRKLFCDGEDEKTGDFDSDVERVSSPSSNKDPVDLEDIKLDEKAKNPSEPSPYQPSSNPNSTQS